MPIHEAALWSAFAQTTYVAQLDTREVQIRVGRATPELDGLLERHDASAWCFVTAWNPGAEALDPADNARRNRALEDELQRTGAPAYYPGEGRGADGRWPAEASFLVIGLDRTAAVRLGARHGQVAVVVGERGGRAELADCRAPRSAHG